MIGRMIAHDTPGDWVALALGGKNVFGFSARRPADLLARAETETALPASGVSCVRRHPARVRMAVEAQCFRQRGRKRHSDAELHAMTMR